MTNPSAKRSTYKTKTTNKGRASLLRLRAEDEPTTLNSSSVTSASNRSIESVRGVPGRSPGLWDVASRAERRGFVSDSERLPRTAQRPGVATPQRSKPLAPPSWGGDKTYNKTHTNNAGVRGRTPAGTPFGTGAGTCPDILKCGCSKVILLGVGRPLAIGSTRPSQERIGFSLRKFSVRLTVRRIYFLSLLFMTSVRSFFVWDQTNNLVLKRQRPLAKPEDCCHFFIPSKDKEKPLVITTAAIQQIGLVTILGCLFVLQAKARKHNGIDSVQVFESADKKQQLWFHEGGSDGGITIFVPTDKHLIRTDK